MSINPIQSAIAGPSPNKSFSLQFSQDVVAGDVLIIKGWSLSKDILTYATPGTSSATVPAGCTSAILEVWGAGGVGGTGDNSSIGGGGGGGGGYGKASFAVTPGDTYTIVVGGSGANSSIAKGATNKIVVAAGDTGDTSGVGNGGAGSSPTFGTGATILSNLTGPAGGTTTGHSGANGGTGAGPGGGSGGIGSNGAGSNTGGNGNPIGGGGGGGFEIAGIGGNGGRGQAQITWIRTPSLSDDQGNSYSLDVSGAATPSSLSPAYTAHAWIYRAVASSGGVRPTVSIDNLAGTSADILQAGLSITEYGHGISSILDTTASGTDSGSGTASASLTTAGTNELVVALGVGDTFSGSGWTSRDVWSGSSIAADGQDRTVATASTVSASESDAGSAACAVVLLAAYFVSAASIFSQSFSDTLSASDAFKRAIHTFLLDQAVPVDTLIPRLAAFRSKSETISLSDAEFNRVNRKSSDSFSLSDRLVNGTSRVLAEAYSITDSLKRFSSRLYTDVASLTESLSQRASTHFSDLLSLSSSVVGTIARALMDTNAPSDSVTKASAHGLTEAISLMEALRISGHKFFSDLADAVSALDFFSGQKNINVSDALSPSDSISGRASWHAAEIVSETDALSGSRGITPKETVSLSDSIGKRISRRLFDVLNWLESLLHTTNPGFGTPIASVSLGSVPIVRARQASVPKAGAVLAGVPVLDWNMPALEGLQSTHPLP